MTQQNFNIGSDATLTILVNGAPVASQILTDWHARQKTKQNSSIAVDGVARYRDTEEGWDLDLMWDRGNSAIDDFFVAKEAGRYAGQQPPEITATETIRNPDGTTSKYRYTGITMTLEDAGHHKGNDKVEQSVKATASRRIKVQ